MKGFPPWSCPSWSASSTTPSWPGCCGTSSTPSRTPCHGAPVRSTRIAQVTESMAIAIADGTTQEPKNKKRLRIKFRVSQFSAHAVKEHYDHWCGGVKDLTRHRTSTWKIPELLYGTNRYCTTQMHHHVKKLLTLKFYVMFFIWTRQGRLWRAKGHKSE